MANSPALKGAKASPTRLMTKSLFAKGTGFSPYIANQNDGLYTLWETSRFGSALGLGEAFYWIVASTISPMIEVAPAVCPMQQVFVFWRDLR